MDSALPIVDLLIQMGDENIMLNILKVKNNSKKKSKNEDNNVNDETEKNHKIEKKDRNENENSGTYGLDLRVFSVLTVEQLESLKVIIGLLTTRQLKALQSASR